MDQSDDSEAVKNFKWKQTEGDGRPRKKELQLTSADEHQRGDATSNRERLSYDTTTSISP